ncbi:MAG: PulJ/GspJ family protein [Thermoguttaceae bacterium]
MKRLRGYSLIECLAAIALTGTAMTIVAVSMSGMHRACQRVREETIAETELQRLAVQLRTDAHQARSAREEKVDAPRGGKDLVPALRLDLGDQEVVQYTAHRGLVWREHHRNRQVLERETYRLIPAQTVRWKVDTTGTFPFVSLQLEADPGDPAGRSRQVQAAVGLLDEPLPPSSPGGQS